VADEFRSVIPEESDEFNGAYGHALLLTKRDVETRQFSKDSTGRLIKERDPKRYTIPGPLDLISEDDGAGVETVVSEGDATLTEGVDEFGGNTENIDADRSSMLNARRRVYKGGSWKDMPHWLNPSTRRYLDEDMSRSDIGFRCAMTRMGAPR